MKIVSQNPLAQLNKTKKIIKNKFINELKTHSFKFNQALKVSFTKPVSEGLLYKTAYFNSKAESVINDIEMILN